MKTKGLQILGNIIETFYINEKVSNKLSSYYLEYIETKSVKGKEKINRRSFQP